MIFPRPLLLLLWCLAVACEDAEVGSEGLNLIEGDIEIPIFDARAEVLGASGISDQDRLWPGGKVNYQIVSASETLTRQAIAHVEENTCIRFFDCGDEGCDGPHIKFVISDGCSSPVGRSSSTNHIRVSDACGFGAFVHEILHSLGVLHEQSRQDRDNYVTIHYENIVDGKEANFDKRSKEDIGTYDYGSLMHYGSKYFSKNGEPTITVNNGNYEIGNRAGMSEGDIETIRHMYRDECSMNGLLTMTVRMTSDDDDCEENVSNGDLNRGSSDLEITKESSQQLIGIRWSSVDIPTNAVIMEATIDFTCDEVGSGDPIVDIAFDLSSDSSSWSTSSKPSDRQLTSSMRWSITNSWSVGSTYSSPNIASQLNEVMSLSGWRSGNAVSVVIQKAPNSNDGTRVAESRNGNGVGPVLRIQYRV
eukprot:TRINITY_DN5181_c0_g1_i2.p1 TRINITY_DN5181_c0_g1~~TRINITY_DN5181_c0_g1_i2.p1  ORF type:complete len:419 (+),score=77.67 TRINITY_DN5181_c0_g1_i2:1068-2324(+)